MATNEVFVAGQFGKRHRSARMQFVGGNADFCAEAEFFAVIEPAAGIPKTASAVHAGEEMFGPGRVFGHNDITVFGPVLVDVADRFVH